MSVLPAGGAHFTPERWAEIIAEAKAADVPQGRPVVLNLDLFVNIKPAKPQ